MAVELHKIKGHCSMLDCLKLKELIHQSENLLVANNFIDLEAQLIICQNELDFLYSEKKELLKCKLKELLNDGDHSLFRLFGECDLLVKNVAGQIGKEIEFRVAGEDYQLSQKIFNSLRHILVALIINSIEHGIEKPQQRILKNKTRSGKIFLNCSFHDHQFEANLSDDGSGLFIKNKKKVSLFSGRGEGLRIVDEEVKKIGGFFLVEANPGVGTTFTLKCVA